MLVWLSVWSKMWIVCMWSSWCHCIPELHLLLPRFNPDWFYLSGTSLPLLSWKKRSLNGCLCESTAVLLVLWQVTDQTVLLGCRFSSECSITKGWYRQTIIGWCWVSEVISGCSVLIFLMLLCCLLTGAKLYVFGFVFSVFSVGCSRFVCQ